MRNILCVEWVSYLILNGGGERMQLLKKNKLEIALVLILLVSLVMFFIGNMKKLNQKEENGDENGKSTIPVQTFADAEVDVPPEGFYDHDIFISQTDFECYQVKELGQTVRFVNIWWNCFDGYVKGDVEPTLKLTINRVVKSEQYQGEKEDGYQYLTFFVTVENDYKLGHIWDIATVNVYDYISEENYTHITSKAHENGIFCHGNEWNKEGWKIDVDQETQGVVFIGEKGRDYAFEEPGDQELVYIESGEAITCKITMKIASSKLEKNQSDIIFCASPFGGRNTWKSSDFAIVIPLDKIEEMGNLE